MRFKIIDISPENRKFLIKLAESRGFELHKSFTSQREGVAVNFVLKNIYIDWMDGGLIDICFEPISIEKLTAALISTKMP